MFSLGKIKFKLLFNGHFMVLLWGWSLTLAKSIGHLARRIPTNTSCACSSYKSPGRRSQISGIIQVHTCTFTCIYLYTHIIQWFLIFIHIYTQCFPVVSQLYVQHMICCWYLKIHMSASKQYVFIRSFHHQTEDTLAQAVRIAKPWGSSLRRSLFLTWKCCHVVKENVIMMIMWAMPKKQLFKVYRGWTTTQVCGDFKKPL